MFRWVNNCITNMLLLSAVKVAWATDTEQISKGEDPFNKITEKTGLATKLMTGDFAIAICMLVIVVAGIALMMGRLRAEWAFKIIGGALLVGSAGAIAEWIM